MCIVQQIVYDLRFSNFRFSLAHQHSKRGPEVSERAIDVCHDLGFRIAPRPEGEHQLRPDALRGGKQKRNVLGLDDRHSEDAPMELLVNLSKVMMQGLLEPFDT